VTSNSNLPPISIITPVLNGQAFIRGCIECVIAQDYPNVEHIIVDGESTDQTLSIVNAMSTEHAHIKPISEKDRGLSDALNKGMRAAKAEYVGVLNVDDFYEPGVLRRVGNLIQRLSEPRFIAGNCNILNERDEIVHVNRPRFLEIEKLLIGNTFYEFPCNHSAYFYPKALHTVAGYYDVELDYQMDVKFILSAVQHIKTLYVDEVWGNFRIRPGTKTFEYMRTGAAASTQRKVFAAAFLNAPLKTKTYVAPRWVIYRLRRRLNKLLRGFRPTYQ